MLAGCGIRCVRFRRDGFALISIRDDGTKTKKTWKRKEGGEKSTRRTDEGKTTGRRTARCLEISGITALPFHYFLILRRCFVFIVDV
jgi:hypothetical protein